VVIRQSLLELEALIEREPREAWEFIGSFAQAELAQMRVDENDKFNYLPMSYWAEDAQQTVVDNISTSLNAQDVDVDFDPSMIRNSVRVSYSQVTVSGVLRDELYSVDVMPITIPPGVTVFRFAFQDAAVFASPEDFTAINDIYLSTNPPPSSLNYFTLSANGSGGVPYATTDQVTARLTAWNAGYAEVTFTNSDSTTWYFINNSGAPVFSFKGFAARVVDTANVIGQEPSSIARRGERALAVSLPTIQSREKRARDRGQPGGFSGSAPKGHHGQPIRRSRAGNRETS
jgi:hypothetical protein